MLVIFDTNVLVSAAISHGGVADRIVGAAAAGRLQLVVSPKLLYELESVLYRPALARRLAPTGPERFVEMLASFARLVADPRRRWPLTENPDDDYLIVLAQITGATLVTGDNGIHDDHPAGMSSCAQQISSTRSTANPYLSDG